MVLELLQYFLKKRYYKNYVSCARDVKKIKINEYCSAGDADSSRAPGLTSGCRGP